jgi:hypothetical protein
MSFSNGFSAGTREASWSAAAIPKAFGRRRFRGKEPPTMAEAFCWAGGSKAVSRPPHSKTASVFTCLCDTRVLKDLCES